MKEDIYQIDLVFDRSEVIAGITGFVQRRGFRAVTEDFDKFSEEEVGFSELASN